MRTLLLSGLIALVAFAGCIGNDATTDTDTGEEDLRRLQEFPLPLDISGLSEVALVETEAPGTGVWLDEERHLLLSAHHGTGLWITDVADPENATVLGRVADVYGRDTDLLEWNGTRYAIMAGAGEGIHVINIDDPTDPFLVFTADEHPSHNVAVVPGTPYVFNAQPYVRDLLVPQAGPTPLDTDRGSTILDIANRTWTEIPFPATWDGVPLTSNGCHDVVVRMDLGLAFCAGGGYEYREGGGETFIWDISKDILKPEFIGMVDNPFIVYHHQALASEDGDLLFINDEHIFPNCQRVDAGGESVGQPTAAMWVYDISDRTAPELISWLQAPDPAGQVPDPMGNCGSHFGDLIDGTDFLVWGWYGGGTLLIDVSDPAQPAITQQVVPHGSIWDARYFNGHVYSADSGISVLRVV